MEKGKSESIECKQILKYFVTSEIISILEILTPSGVIVISVASWSIATKCQLMSLQHHLRTTALEIISKLTTDMLPSRHYFFFSPVVSATVDGVGFAVRMRSKSI